MGKFANTIGIDVSKEVFDAHNYLTKDHKQFANTFSGIKQMLIWVKRTQKSYNNLLFCFEHTGLYSVQLAEYLSEKKIAFVLVPGLEIKRSLGMKRGKNDKIDAYQIAKYAFLRKDDIKTTILPSKSIAKIKRLLSLRGKLVLHRAQFKGSCAEMKSILNLTSKDILIKSQENMIKTLTKQIDAIEAEIESEIKEDPKIDELYQLVTSVKGVGFVLGITFIVYTKCFTAFENWRQFACYSGIAPFDHQSGKSINRPKRVNHMANKKIKGLLSNAATSCIQYCPELREYYQKRLEKGKHKISTQNIIRNKIVARVFAVVNRGTPYVDTMKYAA